jgi:hypothetical protein
MKSPPEDDIENRYLLLIDHELELSNVCGP